MPSVYSLSHCCKGYGRGPQRRFLTGDVIGALEKVKPAQFLVYHHARGKLINHRSYGFVSTHPLVQAKN